ncbi:astacin-like metalloendopeptidase [Penaeus chinensis]|uniref:astacin-like metalloendopeptidase n=1 Tax=Penaeus chinensis TaxID=139456 RepID=UPI001FB830B8|nr:astacin-like metalloendopeptidase [Penaeus chinensis]
MQQLRIRRAMDAIERHTCVRFSPLSAQATFLSVLSNQEHLCWSSHGFPQKKKSITTLDARGCFLHGTLVHELLHAIGLLHMHQRSDRNDHVHIYKENIKRDEIMSFVRLYSETYGLPYDLSSVMHYRNQTSYTSKTAFTMLPRGPGGKNMGQRVDLSPGDVAWVNRMYGCSCHYLGDDLPGATPYESWLSATTIKSHHLAPIDASKC